MRLRFEHWEALRVLAAAEPVGHGWAGPACGISAAVFRGLAGQGLCEMAGRELLPTLGFGRHIGWAARLTTDGHDALIYETSRKATASRDLEPPADPALRLLAVPPADMAVLRRYLSVASQLRHPPAEGLEEAVTSARQGRSGRYEMWLTPAQAASVARAFFLEGVGGAIAAANRLGREYGIVYPSG
ncbi:hypothetical protein ACFH04_06945 [Streptomyces noboritoensis]|uniref:Uncharacterized protein n=1 Tax=Streptomyces noboritoensis TaxID=67337 RepID=A0ABV6TCG3_9ACTN